MTVVDLRASWRALLCVAALGACVPQPVEWDAEARRREGAVADTAVLVLDDSAADGVRFEARWTPPSWPEEPAVCTPTRRAVRALGDEAYASWFIVRPDSSVVLRVAPMPI